MMVATTLCQSGWTAHVSSTLAIKGFSRGVLNTQSSTYWKSIVGFFKMHDVEVHYSGSNCIFPVSGFRANGFQTIFDAARLLCNVKDCKDRDTCYGLPCNPGFCSCWSSWVALFVFLSVSSFSRAMFRLVLMSLHMFLVTGFRRIDLYKWVLYKRVLYKRLSQAFCLTFQFFPVIRLLTKYCCLEEIPYRPYGMSPR